MSRPTEAVTEERSIFRREALEHRARQRGPGDVVRVAPRWTNWLFYVLIGLFVAGLVAATSVDIDRYARGATAIDDQGRVVVLLPAALAPDVARGRPVELGDGGAEVVAFEGTVLSPVEVSMRYGIEVNEPSVAVVTSATQSGAAGGTARVLIESEPLIVAFIPGLKTLFGDR